MSSSVLAAGSPAPDFALRREDGSTFTRADLEGAVTALVFYPFAFSGVCTEQLTLYENALGDVAEKGATVYGVSCDASPSQSAFRRSLGVSIEQLSDFEPKGATCEAFGVLHEAGMAQRALVVIGPDAVIHWSYQGATPAELPGVDLLLEGLAAI